MTANAAYQTLDTLERRLARLEFVTSGETLAQGLNDHAAIDATARIRKLETRLSALTQSSSAASALQRLCM